MGCGSAASYQEPDSVRDKPIYMRKQLIGKGTYGSVYRCVSVTSDAEYAMKVVKINSKTREEAIRQIGNLKTQISLLKKLSHPNIVSYQSFDVSDDQQEVEIVMELVKGGSLKEYIAKNGPLCQSQVVQMCKQLLSALIYLHDQSIIHRDLKCANILLTEDLKPKITDFGTAKIIPTQNYDDIAKLSASLKGTPYYMAPQILKRTGHNQSADIWSFGCTVIQMLSGKAPWTGISSNFSQIIGYICSGIHPPLPPKISKECQYFLQSCLDPIPSKRLKANELIKHRFIDKTSLPLGLGLKSPETNIKPRKRNKTIKTQQIEINDENSEDYTPLSIQKQTKKIGDEKSYQTEKKEQKLKRKSKRTSKKNEQNASILQKTGEIENISQEDIILQNKYFIKQTLQSLKRKKKQQKQFKTTATIKNGEESILQIGNSSVMDSVNIRSHTEMGKEELVINTAISRAERDRYFEQQKFFQKQREQEKVKWQEELREGAQFLKRQISNRYVGKH